MFQEVPKEVQLEKQSVEHWLVIKCAAVSVLHVVNRDTLNVGVKESRIWL
jgi:hypothetical protein